MSDQARSRKLQALEKVVYLISWPVTVGSGFLIWQLGPKLGMENPVTVLVGLLFTMFIVFLFEIIAPDDPEFSLMRDKDLKHDIAFLATGIGVRQLLMLFLAYLLISLELGPWTYLWPTHLSPILQFLIFYVPFSYLGFLQHKLEHSALLWRIHEVHHSPGRLHQLKKDRHHPISAALSQLMTVVPFVLVGIPPEIFAAGVLWEGTNSILKHSNVRTYLPRFLHYIVPSARLHRIHHGSSPEFWGKNYASLPLWDVLHGTFQYHEEEIVYGIGRQYPQSFWKAVLEPFKQETRGS